MFKLSLVEEISIKDSLYKALNVLDVHESEEVGFIGKGEVVGSAITGKLSLTSGVLDKEVSDRIIATLKLPTNSSIRIKVEPTIKVEGIEEDKDSDYDDWRLIDESIINYTFTNLSENLCVLSKPDNADSGERYNAMEWERHSLAVPSVCELITAYLNNDIHDDVALPLIMTLLDYHNYYDG